MFVLAGVCPCAASTSYTEPSLNVTFNVPGNVPFAAVVLCGFVVSSTVASFSAFSIVALSASFTVSAGATPFFQSNAAPTNSAKSTPFNPPNAFTSSAVVFFVALALNVNVFVAASYALSFVLNCVVWAGVQLTVDCLYPSAACASGNFSAGTTSHS